jgi:hypothetical protein
VVRIKHPARDTKSREQSAPARKSSSALRALSAVDLPAHQGDRLLIDRSGVPALDRGKIRLPYLIAGTRAPAVAFEEVRRRG